MSGLKVFLKKIFPGAFLKNASGRYRRIKSATFDKIFFPEYTVPRSAFQIYRNGYPFRENAVETGGIENPEVRSYMSAWYAWTQEEFLLIFDKPCWIEPDHGWAIVSPQKLLYYSLALSRTWFQPKPSFIRFVRRSKSLQLDRAISLRDTGEENYFHFFNDVLSKIFFLKSNSIDVVNTPVIVSSKLWNKPFFKYYLDHSTEFKSLKWVVQDKQYIHCQSAIFCKPLTHRPDLLRQVFEPLYILAEGNRRLYVTRSKARSRFVENSAVIDAIFVKYGFELVDPDLLAPGQQVALFSSASIVAGVHGAGLTNIFFRNGACRIFEIFPAPDAGYLPFHYVMIASMKGFSYNAMIGRKSLRPFSEGFNVDPVQLEASLETLVR